MNNDLLSSYGFVSRCGGSKVDVPNLVRYPNRELTYEWYMVGVVLEQWILNIHVVNNRFELHVQNMVNSNHEWGGATCITI